MRPVATVAELVAGLRAGDRRAVARLLSLVEDGDLGRVRRVVELCHPITGRAEIVGLTGAPGVGKSTLASGLVAAWRRQGREVAVLAIDPSSPLTGGALLGDRIRLQAHALDDGVYVRSMASRGHLGGLAWAAPHALAVLDAAGFDVVLLETVGVGQGEVEVAAVADVTVVAVAPGMGDAVQAAKAGVLEVGDVLCVTKGDLAGAERTVAELEEAQRDGGLVRTPVLRTNAIAGEGIAELVDVLSALRDERCADPAHRPRHRARAHLQVREIAVAALRRRVDEAITGELLDAVARGDIDPYAAADRLLADLDLPDTTGGSEGAG